jgi:hypothetical protein
MPVRVRLCYYDRRGCISLTRDGAGAPIHSVDAHGSYTGEGEGCDGMRIHSDAVVGDNRQKSLERRPLPVAVDGGGYAVLAARY